MALSQLPVMTAVAVDLLCYHDQRTPLVRYPAKLPPWTCAEAMITDGDDALSNAQGQHALSSIERGAATSARRTIMPFHTAASQWQVCDR